MEGESRLRGGPGCTEPERLRRRRKLGRKPGWGREEATPLGPPLTPRARQHEALRQGLSPDGRDAPFCGSGSAASKARPRLGGALKDHQSFDIPAWSSGIPIYGNAKHRRDRTRESMIAPAPSSSPCRMKGGQTRVYALPITHSPPARTQDGVEIPAAVKARLGLDAERSWVTVSEANVFTWPGPDLRFLPGPGSESSAYGFLPPGFFRIVRDRFLAAGREQKAMLVARTE
jgi:hypothetical protein